MTDLIGMTTNEVTLAQELIQVPSLTPDTGRCLDILEKHLKHLGFTVHRKTFTSSDGSYPVENLYARIGTSSPNICFAGHTDVVPIGNLTHWKINPFLGLIKDGYLHGRGTADMKGAIACFLAATSDYLVENELKNGSISFLITGDEEGEAINGTKRCIEWLSELNERLDACIVGEASSTHKVGDVIKIGRRGTLTGFLTVRGKQGHVAYPQLADNPIPRLLKTLTALNDHKFDDKNAFFQDTNFEITTIDVGNSASNIIPAEVHAVFNIRFNPNQTEESLTTWIQEICKINAGEHILKLSCKGDAFLTDQGPFTKIATLAIEDIVGITPRFNTDGGTSDARFIYKICPVLELGVCNGTIHQVDERVPVEDLMMLKRIYKRILKLMLQGETSL